jgi:diguanylate cyclase (GGDEF)-like protein
MAFLRRDSGDADETRPLSRRFTYRYALAVALVSLFVVVVFQQNGQTLNEVKTSTNELEAATQQIGTVQRIVLLADDLVRRANDGEVPSSNDESVYRQAVDDLETTQIALINGNDDRGLPGNPTGELAELWEGSDSHLDQEIQAFAREADTLPGELELGASDAERTQQSEQRADTLVLMHESADPIDGAILAGLDTAVELYTAKLDGAVSARQNWNLWALFVFAALAVLIVVVLFRPMARSIQTETTNLREAEQSHRQNNERQTFHNELNQALEVAETEEELLEAVARAMEQIIGDQPAELMLIDAAGAHLSTAQVNPAAGGPGCPVDSPHACAAIRRGQTIPYDTSRALNVCPKLTQHENAPCSAICSPVLFLGEARGVIHTTGPDLQAPDHVTIERINVLARETGNRLGTMRATTQDKHQATTDGLTGLPNRRSLEQTARDLLAVGRPFAIAMADLDHFKDLNDTYGHEAGDRALKLFAKTMLGNLRPDDTPARYGGEEFVLLLPNASIEEAKQTVDRLRVTLAGELAAAGSVTFTASWGLTTSAAGTTFDEIIVAADEALYAAKRAGRNRIIVGGTPDAETLEPHEAPAELAPDRFERVVVPGVDDLPYAHDGAGANGACASCGNANPQGSRFCLDCGAELTTIG